MKPISLASAPSNGRRVLPVSLCLLTLVLLPQLFADPGGVEYTVQPGDTLELVAKKFNMSVRDLRRQLERPLTPGNVIVLNPSGRNEGNLLSKYIEEYRVKPGDTLQKIAQSLKTKDNKKMMTVEELADFNGLERLEHEVQPGETVTGVARRYGLKPQQLHDWNDLPSGEPLPPGRLLTVGWAEPLVGEWLEYPNTHAIAEAVQKTAQAIEAINKNIRYEVYEARQGDKMERIAAQFKVSVSELRDINGLNEKDEPEEGEPLLIPQAKEGGPPPTSGVPWMPARPGLEARVGTVKRDTEVHLPGAAGTRPLRTGVRLVIVGEEGNQRAVLVSDAGEGRGRMGWVPKQDVEMGGAAFAPVPDEGRVAEMLQTAQSYLGTPYVFGGTSRRGIDCSAFVKAVFANTTGSSLPRTAREQVRMPVKVQKDLTQMQPGDRLYFDAPRLGYGVPDGVDHTGIYMGGGQFIHATPPRVRINALTGRYWNILAAVRRDPQLLGMVENRGLLAATGAQDALASLFAMWRKPCNSEPRRKEQG